MSHNRKEEPDDKETNEAVTEEDHEKLSTDELEEPEQRPGLINADGTINWDCPCLGGMASGPCGLEFREAFSCFHYSKEETKGSDCFEQFRTMQVCMSKYPSVYGDHKLDEEDYEDDEEDDEKGASSAADNKEAKPDAKPSENPEPKLDKDKFEATLKESK